MSISSPNTPTLKRSDSKQTMLWMLMFLFVCMPFPLACNRPWLVFSLGLVVSALVAWQIWFRADALFSRTIWQRAKCFWVLMGLWLLVLVIQLVPLPAAMVTLLSHHFVSDFPIIGEWSTISVDVYSTQTYLIKACIFALLLWLLFSVIDSTKSLELFVKALIFSGFLQAFIGVVLLATGANYTLFFVPIEHIARGKGTFVYHNHFAGYLELTLSLGIGMMIAKLEDRQFHNWKQRIAHWLNLLLSKKAILRIGLIVMVIGLIASRSRMGNSAFFVSLLVVGGLAIALSKKSTKSTVIFIASLIVLDVVIVGSVVGIEKVMQRIENTSLHTQQVVSRNDVQGVVRYDRHYEESVEQRIGPGLHSLEIAKNFPVLGVGGGAFHLAFAPYRPMDVQSYFDHAHNDYFEFAAEVGFVGLFLLAMMVLHSMLSSVRILLYRRNQFARGIAIGSLMGIVSLLIHSSVDFNLQNTTNGMLFVVVLVLPYLVKASQPERRLIS